ncbi:transglycosylase SLT domain-containing protein [Nocardia pseudovaccinii]|uniref:transglycosylase SLT domain-containing protein n=1 Tax=Nocardia pseudovaccinii TaxID=189540 RepID=UPI0007A42E71|nr:transglycosylase SLT domain-containing protein [Nocardia pseudovaccinii]
MLDKRLTSFRRLSLRDSVTLAVAAAGLIAVGTSSVVALADDSVPSRIAMVAEEQPAPAAAPAAAPAVDAAATPVDAPLIPALPALPELPPVPGLPLPPPPAPVYEDNLDGWIHHALDIMAANGIPGSYNGIYRNIMRESGGNPQAINLWDSNAAAGIPSKGLLQVIDPTFNAYHVEGTAWDIWDPVANITAACNYAAHRYGSMDNVNSAY